MPYYLYLNEKESVIRIIRKFFVKYPTFMLCLRTGIRVIRLVHLVIKSVKGVLNTKVFKICLNVYV